MGNKDSRPAFLTYEDAVKRVTDAELKRLKEAFKRSSTLNGFMTKPVFVREVLGDGFPPVLADKMFETFGGTAARGLAFKDLVCGLVLLTRGRREEKIRFIFGLHADVDAAVVTRAELEALEAALAAADQGLHAVGVTEFDVAKRRRVETLDDLFGKGSLTDRRTGNGDVGGDDAAKVGFDAFRHWLLGDDGDGGTDDNSRLQSLQKLTSQLTSTTTTTTPRNSERLCVTRWLLHDHAHVTLSNDDVTPTFYQTLAGVTHLEESDIIELEKRYWMLKAGSKTGRFDLPTFRGLVSPPMPPSLVDGVFNAFDENRDDNIDFKEMACGISAACRGPIVERLKFCFKIFDLDRDGTLSGQEIEGMIRAIKTVRTTEGLETSPLLESDLLYLERKTDLTLDDYLVWTMSGSAGGVVGNTEKVPETTNGHTGAHTNNNGTNCVHDFLSLLFQVCHIVLGLRPSTKAEEGKIVKGWLEREERKGLTSGDLWYLVSSSWWQGWKDYVGYIGGGGGGGAENSSSSSSLPPSMTSSMESGGSASSPGSKSGTLDRRRGQQGDVFSGAEKYNDHTLNAATSLANPPVTPNKKLNFRPNNGSNGSSVAGSTGGNSLSASSSPTPNSLTPINNVTPSVSPSASPRLGKRRSSIPSRPSLIDNSSLIVPNALKAIMLTNEGGRLKKPGSILQGRDFELLPDPVWKALWSWYGGTPALPRLVIKPKEGEKPEVELYPIQLRLLRHQAPAPGANAIVGRGVTTANSPYGGSSNGAHATTFGIWGAAAGMAVSAVTSTASTMTSSYHGNNASNVAAQTPKRYLAYLASFSRMHTVAEIHEFLSSRLRLPREDIRLWLFESESCMTLVEEEDVTLEDLRVENETQFLIEVRNKDLTWPEELSLLTRRRLTGTGSALLPAAGGHAEPGATGLNNLGNTCFMNSAVQCVSNTSVLTSYFASNLHLYELNCTNPLGMKGHLARRYGDLMQDLWSGASRTVAPIKFRWTIGKYAPQFAGFQQHDAQELLAFLLDGLHEDLNRVQVKPYVELKDSDGRPDFEVAREAWENHLRRNQSIIVDLFHGQLKSRVRCKTCGSVSVRFDPFNVLSLPLPMDSCIHVEIMVLRLDGSVPVKYGLRMSIDDRYTALKEALSKLCGLAPNELLLVEVLGAMFRSIPEESTKVKSLLGGTLMAYQVPPPAPIRPMSAEEEREDERRAKETAKNASSTTSSSSSSTTTATTTTLGEIQRRAIINNNNNNNYLRLEQKDGNDEKVSNAGPSASSHPSSSTSAAVSSDSDHGRAVIVNGDASRDICNDQVDDAIDGNRSQGNISKGITLETDRSENGVINGAASRVDAAPNDEDAEEIRRRRREEVLEPGAVDVEVETSGPQSGFVIAVHRKILRMDVYFLSSQKSRPSLFGTPLLLPFYETTSQQDLYASVWAQIARLVSPLPPSEASSPSNHALDCDDSLGYEYPFVLKRVKKDGYTCSICPWYRFCRGCRMECDSTPFRPGTASLYVAVDWDPTALHLRYQASQERAHVDDDSVALSRHLVTSPIDLDACLQAFTKEEELGEDERVYCKKCESLQCVSKKLDIWELPPILIIHLKRFQYVNARWVKSSKVVKFPMSDFEPARYLAPRDPESAEMEEREAAAAAAAEVAADTAAALAVTVSPATEAKEGMISPHSSSTSLSPPVTSHHQRQSSKTSLSEFIPAADVGEATSPAADDAATSASSGVLPPAPVNSGVVVKDRKSAYNLYGISCHNGILGGGHYVSYARNSRSKKWYCYNDSSCREVTVNNVDFDSAYLLFYERQNLESSRFLPRIPENCRGPQLTEYDALGKDDKDFDTDYGKACVLQ